MGDELFVLPVPFATYVELRQFLPRHGITQELHEVVDQAINDWMRALEASHEEAASSSLKGYQWKKLFLPEGTKLRTVREGLHHIAQVVDSKVIFEGRPCSPSQFVNEVHGTCRNAWKTVWLLRPDESEWTLANEYRGGQIEFQAQKSSFKNKKARLSTFKTNSEIEIVAPTAKDSLLHIAAQLNDLETMAKLLAGGHDPNSLGDAGATPLHCAWSEEARSLLLSFGASPEMRDDAGRLAGEVPEQSC